MAEYRQQHDRGRNDPRGFDDRGQHEQAEQAEQAGPPRPDHPRNRDRSLGGFGKGSSRDRMGSEQFRSDEDFGDHGEHEYRDFGRGQSGGAYEHSGSRDYQHGSGYGGFGESPGESGGGFDSGRSYAAEPGWGPDYGQHGSGGEHRQVGPSGSSRRRRHGPKNSK
jgi:hypothetical protein